MGTDKSGAGYGNHGGDDSMGGQDGAKSGDHEPGSDVNKGPDPTRTIPDDSGKGGYEDEGEADG